MSSRAPSRKVYAGVFAALCVLLVLTVAAAMVDLGPLNVIAAIAIATAKAALIALYFMHVRYNSNLARLFAVAGFLWLAILIGMTLGDYLTRQARGAGSGDNRARVTSATPTATNFLTGPVFRGRYNEAVETGGRPWSAARRQRTAGRCRPCCRS